MEHRLLHTRPWMHKEARLTENNHLTGWSRQSCLGTSLSLCREGENIEIIFTAVCSTRLSVLSRQKHIFLFFVFFTIMS